MNECYKYGMAHGCDKFCPVHKDEITFYEDIEK